MGVGFLFRGHDRLYLPPFFGHPCFPVLFFFFGPLLTFSPGLSASSYKMSHDSSKSPLIPYEGRGHAGHPSIGKSAPLPFLDCPAPLAFFFFWFFVGKGSCVRRIFFFSVSSSLVLFYICFFPKRPVSPLYQAPPLFPPPHRPCQ